VLLQIKYHPHGGIKSLEFDTRDEAEEAAKSYYGRTCGGEPVRVRVVANADGAKEW